MLLTTQYLEEADQLADRITIVDRGQAIATGTSEELKGLAGRDVVEVRVRQPDQLSRAEGVMSALGLDEPRVDAPARRSR